MRKAAKLLIKGYYKLSAFAVTIILGSDIISRYGIRNPLSIFYIIFGLGFYLGIVELFEEFCPIET